MRRARCRPLSTLLLVACSSVSPRPDELAERQLPVRELSADDRATLARMEADARRALAMHRYDDAERTAAAVLALDPRAARARAVYGLALLQRALAVQPPDLVLQNRGDGETATAVRLAPADPVVSLLRGTFLATSGHVSAAAATAEECLRQNPPGDQLDDVELLAAAADWCYELGEEARAVPWLRMLTERRADDATAWFRLGSCQLRLAEDEPTAVEAARAFARSAALALADPEAQLAVATAWVRAAEIADEAGRRAAAADALQQAQAACAAAAGRFPAAAEPWYRTGVIAERAADPAAARQAYESALQRDRDHLPVLLDYAALLAATGVPADRERAHDCWRRALDVDARHGGLRPGERRRIEALLAK